MEDILKLKELNKLKETYRFAKVGNGHRNESTAEHTWGCLILADYFISKYGIDVDRLKVYELLMYHDVVEIEAGDTPLNPDTNKELVETKEDREQKAAENFKKNLPEPINNKFYDLFQEFDNLESKEAKFANAIDKLEGEIQELDYKEDWIGWTKEYLMEKKISLYERFPST